MSTLFWIWLVSLLVASGLYLRGFIRAKMTPVSYEWTWSPIAFVTGTVFPEGRMLWLRIKEKFQQTLHSLFHAFFHQMKKYHDRVFGKTASHTQGTPSFFLKTIAEHQETIAESEKVERKKGLS